VIKVLVIYPWPNDVSGFKQYYLECHLPLCRAIPGTEHISYAFEPETIQDHGQWFCIYEAEYADRTAFLRAQQTPEAKAAAADVANYSPRSPMILVYEPRGV
jgi:uncharacterized protein (TIGR02118 family)